MSVTFCCVKTLIRALRDVCGLKGVQKRTLLLVKLSKLFFFFLCVCKGMLTDAVLLDLSVYFAWGTSYNLASLLSDRIHSFHSYKIPTRSSLLTNFMLIDLSFELANQIVTIMLHVRGTFNHGVQLSVIKTVT